MVNSNKENDDRKIDGSSHENQFSSSSSSTETRSTDSPSQTNGRRRRRRTDVGIAQRLREIVRNGEDNQEEEEEEEERDLLLQQSDREDNVFQWLQALDLQVMGACRADERLKPLLKMNISNGAAEDRLLSHLIQHFEASEVGMLARCFFMPLVSIRVGKIIKQGKILCPTADRGILNLILLPSSDLRISFVGDDGCTERLATLSSNCENSAVLIDEISGDSSGRSFVLKLPSNEAYFWCSEKSKCLGSELLAKMKDILRRKPSLSELTGISDSRLECFAIHLLAYLLGSTVSISQSNSIVSSISSLNSDSASEPAELDSCFQESSSHSRTSCQHSINQATNAQSLLVLDNLHVSSNSMINATNICSAENKLTEVKLPYFPSSLSFLESLGDLAIPSSSIRSSEELPASQDSAAGSFHLSPYYCWCPPGSSTQKNMTISSTESSCLPPLSSLASGGSSSSLVSWKSPFNLAEVSALDFPAIFPDPVQVPLPISSLGTVPSSQQIPTFTPLMSEPIVHIPAIGICSSGQGYVVGAGHSIPATISPLHPHIINPLITDSESIVEKGARDTLRLLLSSAQGNPWSVEALPAALTSTCDGHGLLIGSGSMHAGTTDAAPSIESTRVLGSVSLPNMDMADLVDSEKQAEGSGGCSDGFGTR